MAGPSGWTPVANYQGNNRERDEIYRVNERLENFHAIRNHLETGFSSIEKQFCEAVMEGDLNDQPMKRTQELPRK